MPWEPEVRMEHVKEDRATRPRSLVLAAAFIGAAVITGTSCAQGQADGGDPNNVGDDGGGSSGSSGDGSSSGSSGSSSGSSGSGSSGDGASCGTTCDADGDKVPDPVDKCPGTPPGATVNKDGCAETQITPKLEGFPPYGLTWTPTGNLGRAGGLTWTYTGIQRADLFHIWWVVCDDPGTPCGLSLDGPIDVAGEKWLLSAADSDLPAGKLVFTNSTQISLADGGPTTLTGRLTMTIVDASDAPFPFAAVATLGVTTARDGKYGAEIKGTGFKVKAIVEVMDAATWKPYLDYYDAAATPNTGDAGGNATSSFGGSFYDK